MKKYIKLLRIKYHMIMQMFHTKEACIHSEACKQLVKEYLSIFTQ